MKNNWQEKFNDADFLRGNNRGDLDYISEKQRKNIKSFIMKSLSDQRNEIITKVESVEDVLILQYQNALQNKEDGEANGYAHSLAIVKDLHREFTTYKMKS